MTLEERVERLENFTGDIDKIISVYANSIQEICDKYLNLLYIEEEDASHPNYLVVNGFLSDLSTIDKVPKNVMFNIRASHTFAYNGDDHSSKLRLTRTDLDTNTTVRLDIPLKKYDIENPGNLVFLEPGDFIQGILYGVYINSQGIAIISSNDSGTVALQEVTQLRSTIEDLEDTIQAMTATQTVGSINVTNATVSKLTVPTELNLTNPVTMPTGSSCSTPTNDSDIVNKKYVEDAILAAINDYHANYHLFDTADPSTILPTAKEKAIYYRY